MAERRLAGGKAARVNAWVDEVIELGRPGGRRVLYAGNVYDMPGRQGIQLDGEIPHQCHEPRRRGPWQMDEAYGRPRQVSDAELFTERTVDDINQLRETLIRQGWVTGKLLDPRTGRMCLLGGIQTIDDHSRRDVLREALGRFITKHDQPEVVGAIIGDIAAWNDKSGRTFAEVTDMLDRCARWVKEKING
jgi:hypothetical protein